MVAYSFKEQFVEPIVSGRKRQTIRSDRKRHAKAGEELQLYTGMRTKVCRLIGRARCLEVLRIRIDFQRAMIWVGSLEISGLAELDAFAKRDGFASYKELRDFWDREHDRPSSWSGMIIFWDRFERAAA